MQLHCRGCTKVRWSGLQSAQPLNLPISPMIPEIENKNSVVSFLRRNLHLALRRRTWSFKRNARLEALLPRQPERGTHSWWFNAVPALLAMLVCRA